MWLRNSPQVASNGWAGRSQSLGAGATLGCLKAIGLVMDRSQSRQPSVGPVWGLTRCWSQKTGPWYFFSE